MSQLDNLAQEIAAIIGRTSVDVDVPISQIGIDSLNVVDLIIVCQNLYPNFTNYEDIDINEHTTITEIDDQLSRMGK